MITNAISNNLMDGERLPAVTVLLLFVFIDCNRFYSSQDLTGTRQS